MKEWLKISCLLCVFGFVRELRPSESYIIEYLLGDWRNITEEQLNRDVNPVGTYSYLAQLVAVFLITDFLRYKPLIIIIGISGIIVWSMLIWTTSLQALQASEFFYGTYSAAEVAYYTYIYAKVDKKYYPKVSAHTRAAMFAGKFVAGMLAQLLVLLKWMDYKELNYISLATQIFATLWAFSLPKVDRSLYFHQKINVADDVDGDSNASRMASSSVAAVSTISNQSNTNENTNITLRETADNKSMTNGKIEKENLTPFKIILSHFINAYTNLKVVQWSCWYALALCGYLQVCSYMQILWKDIEPNIEIAWNGAVDSVLTALAALSALAAGYIHAGRLKPQASLILLAILSALEGGTILLCCRTENIYWSYVGFILFGALYAFTITVASAEVARYLEDDSFALVFGINTLIALILQTILTLVVVSKSGFALSVKGQYTVYAFYYIVIGILYISYVCVEYFLKYKTK